MKLRLLFLVFFLSSTTLIAQPHMAIPFDTNVDQLFSTLKKHKISNVTDAVELLDQKFFKKKQYALIFKSRSPQTGTPEFPRILLFGKDKKIRIGFNHRKKDGQDLEVIQWRETTATWEFREISFKGGQVSLSKANPGMCLHCHRDHKPKFKSQLTQSLRNVLQGAVDLSPFAKHIKTDSIYRKLESPL